MTEEIPTSLLIAETLEAMALIDRTEECGDCMIWTGAIGTGGHPIYRPHGKTCTLVRRSAYHLSGRTLIPRKPLVATCRDNRCINPAHTVASTTAKVAQAAAARGAYSTLKRRAAIAAGVKHRRKITDEQALEILTSAESGPVLAARYGVHRSLITRIRAMKARVNLTNPYLQLMKS